MNTGGWGPDIFTLSGKAVNVYRKCTVHLPSQPCGRRFCLDNGWDMLCMLTLVQCGQV